MKKYFTAMAVTAVCVVAFVDTKSRIEELEEIAANTPAQVEMKKDAPKSSGEGVLDNFKPDRPETLLDNQKFDNMINKPDKFPDSKPSQGNTTRPNIPTFPQIP